MLLQWLRNGTKPTWDKLLAAIRIANTDCAQCDGERALNMIYHLKRVVRRWETTDRDLLSDLRTLVDKLQKLEEWMNKARQWKEENDKWEEGDDAKMSKDLEEAISGGNFANNPFAVLFLYNSGLPHPSLMGDKKVRGTLIRGIADIKIDRTKALISQFEKLKEHKKELEALRSKTKELSTLLDKRSIQGEEIINGLLDLGVKAEKLKTFKIHITHLKEKAQKSVKLAEECDQTCKETERYVQSWKYDLQAYNNTLEQNISDIERKTFTPKVVAGSVVGGAVGTFVLPILGTVAGGVFGGVLGHIIERMDKESYSEIIHYNNILRRAQAGHSRLETLLKD